MSSRVGLIYQYYSPIRIQSEQKDIIIGQLKNQIYQLKKNQQQYFHLQDQLHSLQKKYKMLYQEKISSDNQFRSRHQMAMKNINIIKNQADNIKADFRQRRLQLSDLQADGNTLKTQYDQRNIQIERLKNDTNSLLADTDQLNIQRTRLENQFTILQQQKLNLISQLNNLQKDNDSVNIKLNDIDKYLFNLGQQGKNMHADLISLQNQNNRLDMQIQKRNDQFSILQKNIIDAQRSLKQQKTDLAQLSADIDKFKSQTSHLSKVIKQQISKNNQIINNIKNGQNILRTRQIQLADGKVQINDLSHQNQKIFSLNNRLINDLDACKTHIENLVCQNNFLVNQLQKFSLQDDEVRSIIDRKTKVIFSRNKYEDSKALSRTTVNCSRLIKPKIL